MLFASLVNAQSTHERYQKVPYENVLKSQSINNLSTVEYTVAITDDLGNSSIALVNITLSSQDYGCETAFYCEDFETVTAPAIPNGMTTISAEDNYYVPAPGAGSVTPGAGVLVSGFYTGNGDDANVGGFYPTGEHTQFAMTNDDACLPANSAPNADNNCDLSLERLILPTLDFTGQEGMWILFEYYHDGAYGGGDANVELSLDGGTTWMEINDEPLATAEAWQTAAFDLSSYDNSPSVTIRITWSDDTNWASGFAVDDIVVNPLPDYAMNMIDKQHVFPSQYFGATSYNDVPLTQASATAYNFMGYLKNLGLNALDSARLYASITSEGFNSESFGINTVSLGQDTFYCNDFFTATELGTYTADIYGGSENDIATESESVSFNVTEFDYSRDLAGTDNGYTGGSFINDQGSEQRGNVFDIYADADLHAIKVRIHPATSPNCRAKAVLNSIDITTGDVTFLTETSLKNVGAYTDDWYNFVFDSPIPLAAGEVVLATIFAEFDGIDTLVLATNGQTAQGETLLQDIDGTQTGGAAGDWYYTTAAAMVRLNFDPNVVDVSTSWNCVNGGCVDPMDGTGIYSSLNDCEANCFMVVEGCTNELACNYNINATDDDGSCTYTDGICESCEDGDITDNDMDNDGICDEDEIAGCTDELACNYNINATDDDGSCYNLSGSITQSGDSLFAVFSPDFVNVNWYNVQSVNDSTRYWLMAENSASFEPTFDCSYFIIVNSNGCSYTSPVYYYSSEAKSIGKLSTSPNPSDGVVKVKFENNKNQFVKLQLINNNGYLLDEFLTTKNELEIDLSSYPAGTYHVSFNSPDSKDCLNKNTFQKIANTIILK